MDKISGISFWGIELVMEDEGNKQAGARLVQGLLDFAARQ